MLLVQLAESRLFLLDTHRHARAVLSSVRVVVLHSARVTVEAEEVGAVVVIFIIV